MGDTVTLKKNGDVNGCRFPGDGFQVAETAHDVEHLVLVEDDDALGEFLVVTAVFVGFESRVQKFCDVLCDEVILFVGDPQVVAAETGGMLVDHVRNGDVVQHPAITQETFQEMRADKIGRQHLHDAEPPGVIVESVFDTTPFTAFFRLFAGCVEIAQALRSNCFSHITCLPESS